MAQIELTPILYKTIQTLAGYKLKIAEDDDLKKQMKIKHGILEDDVTSAVLLMTQLGYTQIKVENDLYFVQLTTLGLRQFQEY